MGGGDSVTQTAEIPEEFKPLINSSSAQIQNLQGMMSIGNFAQQNPQLIAGLSPLMAYAIEQSPGLGMVQPAHLGAFSTAATIPEITAQPIPQPGAEKTALQGIQYLTGGPLGMSPATTQGMKAWEQSVLPTVQNQNVLAGLGNSGAYTDAAARSATEASVPLIQTEIQNRVAMIPMLQEIARDETARFTKPRDDTVKALTTMVGEMRMLGDSMFKQKLQAIQTQFAMGQVTRDIAQQQADAAYNDYLRLQALAESASFGVFGTMAPSAMGFTQEQDRGTMGQISDIMQIAGPLIGIAGMAMMSDPKSKTKVKRVDSGSVLDRLRGLDVNEYEYKRGVPGGRPGRHIGPMADDFNERIGKEGRRVGGLETIDMADMLGALLAATQALNERVDDLEGGPAEDDEEVG